MPATLNKQNGYLHQAIPNYKHKEQLHFWKFFIPYPSSFHILPEICIQNLPRLKEICCKLLSSSGLNHLFFFFCVSHNIPILLLSSRHSFPETKLKEGFLSSRKENADYSMLGDYGIWWLLP